MVQRISICGQGLERAHVEDMQAVWIQLKELIYPSVPFTVDLLAVVEATEPILRAECNKADTIIISSSNWRWRTRFWRLAEFLATP